MTQRNPRPVPERVHLIEIAQARHARELARLDEEAKRSAEQAEGAIDDVRDLQALVRVVRADGEKTRAMVLAVGGQQGEILSVLRDMAEEMAAQRSAVSTLSTQLATTRVRHEERFSAIEARDLELARDIGVAMAEGQEIADRREAKRRLIAGLTSVPVLLAIIGLIARCSGGL